MQTILAGFASLLVLSAGAGAQQPPPGPGGDWRVQFAAPLRQVVVTMTILQAGTKLTGHVVDEYGEYEIRGQFVEGVVTVVWSVSEEGKMLEITMKGTLDGNEINGTATLGDVGEGSLWARRTALPDPAPPSR